MLYIRTVLHIEDTKSDQIVSAARICNNIETQMLLGLGLIYSLSRF